jgi:hypothetical protein
VLLKAVMRDITVEPGSARMFSTLSMDAFSRSIAVCTVSVVLNVLKKTWGISAIDQMITMKQFIFSRFAETSLLVSSLDIYGSCTDGNSW